MYCHQCGSKVPEGARFCSTCGASLSISQDTYSTESVEHETETSQIPENQNPQLQDERMEDAPYLNKQTVQAQQNEEEPQSKQLKELQTEQQTEQQSEILTEPPTEPAKEPQNPNSETLVEVAAAVQTQTQSKVRSQQRNTQPEDKPGFSQKLKKYLFVIIPIVSLLGVSGGVFAYYNHETTINQQVKEFKTEAEKAATKGQYQKAIKALDKGIQLRPDYKLLQTEKETVKTAQSYSKSINQIAEYIRTKKFDDATKELNTLSQMLTKAKGPLFKPFKQQLKEKEVSITVGKIKQEIDGLQTIEELGGKLTVVASLSSDEANAVKTQITNKIIQLASDQAEGYLQNKDFDNALSVIDSGLSYSKDEAKLLAFKERVQSEKAAFEKAEQDRIEQAMEAAAKEDLKNHTAAVDVLSFNVELDEYGDAYLTGEVKNSATTSIYSIQIEYTVFDAVGEYSDTGYTTVYPYYLEPGETGSFEDIIYYVDENVKVEINNIKWYLD
ncbi:FxLYD domain-containing protein [Bacillus marasmi]|uniref:FxLYD domain-containing protein n=1 Tax=Bacillus marasmi TaxID=1926279 RepID=UPI0011CC7261|nr:FxLYD domain-containing protein [Bacillus marasmi]